MFHLTPILTMLMSLLPLQLDQVTPTRPAVIDNLIGDWEGQGELFGQPASFSMSWSWQLDRRFVRLDFENRLVSDGQPRTVLKAIAFYRVTVSRELGGYWFDSRGQTLRLEPIADESTLITTWLGEVEQGRTTYRISGQDTVEVLDEVLKDGQWRPFGTASYRRLLSPAR